MLRAHVTQYEQLVKVGPWSQSVNCDKYYTNVTFSLLLGNVKASLSIECLVTVSRINNKPKWPFKIKMRHLTSIGTQIWVCEAECLLSITAYFSVIMQLMDNWRELLFFASPLFRSSGIKPKQLNSAISAPTTMHWLCLLSYLTQISVL